MDDHDPDADLDLDAYERKLRRDSGGRQIIIGIVLLVAGIAITAATCGAASGGGTYLICYGPIAGGIVSIVRGMTRIAG